MGRVGDHTLLLDHLLRSQVKARFGAVAAFLGAWGMREVPAPLVPHTSNEGSITVRADASTPQPSMAFRTEIEHRDHLAVFLDGVMNLFRSHALDSLGSLPIPS